MKQLTRGLWIALVLLLVCGLVVPLAQPALAQDGDSITLVPFESEAFGLQGLVPEGWSEAAPGAYARGAGMGDLTSLVIQAAPGMTTADLTGVLLGQLGIEALPEPVGEVATDHFTFTIYAIEVSLSGMDIALDLALAEDDAGVTLVLLQTLAEDYPPLHEAVFLPAVDALAPLGEDDGAGDAEAEFVEPAGRYSVPIPTNWTAEDRGDFAVLMGPDGLLVVSIVVLDEEDPDAALAAAWALVDPDFAVPLDETIEVPTGDLDLFTVYSYEFDADEDDPIVQAEVRQFNGVSYVLIFAMDFTTVQQRSAQVQIIDSGFSITDQEQIDISGLVPAPLAEVLADFEAYIAEALDLFDTPGAAVAIVQDGEIVYAEGFGVRNPAGDPVTPDTRQMIGSTTKTMTTLLMAQLVDEGLMAWDTPVTDVLPSFAVADPAVTAQITMENLVCACTGVPRRDFEWLFAAGPETAEEVVESLAEFEFFTDFGEAFQYSNQMVATGGYLAALAAGGEYGNLYDDYVKLIEAQIFEPIGMDSTTFDFAEVLASADYAQPYSQPLNGDNIPVDMAIEEPLVVIGPAGAAWSTANDMARYMITLMQGGVTPDGDRIVSQENLNHLRQPQVAISAADDYGLGWIISDYKGQTMYSHAGNTLGFSSEFAYLPDSDIGIVVLTNQRASFLNSAVRGKLFELLFDLPAETHENLAFALDLQQEGRMELIEKLHQYPGEAIAAIAVGNYHSDVLGDITINQTGDGALTVSLGSFTSELWLGVDEEQDADQDGIQDDGQIGFAMYDPPLVGIPLKFVQTEDNAYQLIVGAGVNEYAFTRLE